MAKLKIYNELESGAPGVPVTDISQVKGGGNLADLATENKTNLVASINEIYSNIPKIVYLPSENWLTAEPDESTIYAFGDGPDPLTITAIEDATIVITYDNDSWYGRKFYYNRNGEWQLHESSVEDYIRLEFELKAGENLYLKCDNEQFGIEPIARFTISGRCSLSGVVSSLSSNADGSVDLSTAPHFAYSDLFNNCDIVSVDKGFLPATILGNGCYRYMFYGCTSLVEAPELPATVLNIECYMRMFYGCTSLVEAPELPATTLNNTRCYSYMFYGCSSLSYIKALFTTTPATRFTEYWVSGVASNGTFVKSKDATWDVTGVHGVPIGWTVEGGVSIIEFTINGTTYQAEEGMTWAEWVESDYNTGVYYIADNNYVVSGANYYINARTLAYVVASDIIEPKGSYMKSSGGSDD